MKKIMMVAITLIVSVSTFAQTKITGFGKIQLGMKVSDFTELQNAKPAKNSDYHYKVYKNTTDAVYESVLDTTLVYPSFSSLDKRVRVFQIGKLQLTESITLTDVRLKFFEDKLYEIEIHDKKMDELMTLKFGSPKEDVKTKDNTFVNGYGVKSVKTDLTKTHTWETGDSTTSCWYTDMYWYSDKGELRYIGYAALFDKSISKKVEIEENKVTARIRQREEDKKKELAKGF
jgi:hypothetical protein